MSERKVRLFVIGAGSRGRGYSAFAEAYPERLEIVGIAEPREFYRNQMIELFNIPSENIFTDWRQAVERERFADAVLVATQDALHTEPALAFIERGYHMLLEKPMAPTEAECRRIVAAAVQKDVLFAICHVMRYTRYTQTLKRLLDEGAVGEIISVQHLEPVGHWHQAHSYVRGNWRNEAESSPMLLAKSCHDLDWIRYIMGCSCRRVSSFGSLIHFRRENQPAGAADRCLDCGIEAECPYSAKKYFSFLSGSKTGYPIDVLTSDKTVAGVTAALRTGPYGRCVYACDNDVVDHQVVNMEFEGGQTATFTMTAFAIGGYRRTSIFGTRGEIYGDGDKITIRNFTDEGELRVIETGAADATILGGHGGGDFGLMKNVVSAIAANDISKILSGPEESLESHLMVFAAERARHNGTVEKVL